MADHLLATASEIRAELAKLDARRARLRKLLAIAEEDEAGKAPVPAAEAAPQPETKPEAPIDVNAEVLAGIREAEARHAEKPAPAKAEPSPARRGR